MLVHLLDGLAEDPIADFFQINSELALFDPNLASKPQVVAFNKIDLPQVEARWPAVQKALKARGYEAQAISAVAQTNVRQLLYRASQLLAETEPAQVQEAVPVYRHETDPNEYAIEKLDEKTYRVTGQAIERAAAMTYWEHDQSVRRFQRILETIGIDSDLREAGVQPGHTVFIGDYELEWQD